MSNHFKKERRGVEINAHASGDVLYEEFKRPVNSPRGGIRGGII